LTAGGIIFMTTSMNIEQEWEEAFPFDQEYQMWMASIERDFREEIEHRGVVIKQQRDRVLFDEEFSPFSTVNS